MKANHFIALIVIAALTPIAEAQQAAQYSDAPRDHWAYESLHRMSVAGVLEGQPDGFFHGGESLPRYEFSVAMARLLAKPNICYMSGPLPQFRWKSLDELEKNRLFPRAQSSDVSRDHYAYNAVQLVQQLGIMQGNPQNQFLGDKPMTRYELAVALERLQKYWILP